MERSLWVVSFGLVLASVLPAHAASQQGRLASVLKQTVSIESIKYLNSCMNGRLLALRSNGMITPLRDRIEISCWVMDIAMKVHTEGLISIPAEVLSAQGFSIVDSGSQQLLLVDRLVDMNRKVDGSDAEKLLDHIVISESEWAAAFAMARKDIAATDRKVQELQQIQGLKERKAHAAKLLKAIREQLTGN